MKNSIILLFLVTAIMSGCCDNKEPVKKEAEVKTKDVTKTEIDPLTNNWIRFIQLDKGKKWKANAETNIGVNNMLVLIKETDPQTVKDYHSLAERLNVKKNKLVKECTMEGPSHENLHIFLHPLIEKINSLSKVPSVKEGEEITKNILENLETYQKYFK